MSTHKPRQGDDINSKREGYELSDVSVPGILVFLIALAVSVGVFFVFCFGMGKVINNALTRSDGPANQWNQFNMPVQKSLKMESNPQMEQKQLSLLTQTFPTPRLENDDGNMDLANLHQREDLLLNYYSWVDESKGSVRIPIERAMQIIAQRGLPVASQSQQQQPMMFGDSRPGITAPLTDGFAPTGYEQELASQTKLPGEQSSARGADNQ